MQDNIDDLFDLTTADEAGEYNPNQEAQVYKNAGCCLSCLATFFLPPLFGPVAVVLGVVAVTKGDEEGWATVASGMFATAVGILFSWILYVMWTHH
jgi:hypothetical protein